MLQLSLSLVICTPEAQQKENPVAWKTFYFTGDGMYPDVRMLVQSKEDWEKVVKAYKGDLEKLRGMQPEVNHGGYGGPGIVGDDMFFGEPTLGELLDSMEGEE